MYASPGIVSTRLPNAGHNVAGTFCIRRSDHFSCHLSDTYCSSQRRSDFGRAFGRQARLLAGYVGRFPRGMHVPIDEVCIALQTVLSKIPPNDKYITLLLNIEALLTLNQ